jgi:hypothetical protein
LRISAAFSDLLCLDAAVFFAVPLRIAVTFAEAAVTFDEAAVSFLLLSLLLWLPLL